ncbi:hypothetical protein AQJ66_30720 [Streptomyces bungoensis]|uniref:Uncharacterized protein n=1 Tax=Streptomyces bungoensis TaxID=285568 RepID=A0A117R9L2_9ACTN|nr:hypothetical protein [Streptomyces bungoensis]KUN78641.1 hypothetical protein AQJ66_30720 [Streptomyces bungoensis]
MATDGCGPDDCPAALNTSLARIFELIHYGGPLSAAALLAPRPLPAKRRRSVPRAWTAGLALPPPATVLHLVWTLPVP